MSYTIPTRIQERKTMGSCPTCLAIWDEGDRCPRCLASAPETLEDIRSSLREELHKAVEEAAAEVTRSPGPAAVEAERSPLEVLRSNLREELRKVAEGIAGAPDPAVESSEEAPPEAAFEAHTPNEAPAGSVAPAFVLDIEIPEPGRRRGGFGGRRRDGIHPLEVRYWAAVGTCVIGLLLLGGRETGTEPEPSPSTSTGETSVKSTPPTTVWVPDEAPAAVTTDATLTSEPS